jgi:DNA polymerase (family X)
MKKPSNEEIARLLEQVADLLEAQEANTFRIRAYRSGAAAVRAADKKVAGLVKDDDTAALRQLPDIGEGLAALIAEYAQTGRSTLLERLQGEVTPEDVFTKVPGIGEELASRISRELDIQTLEELEQTAHDGRLAQVEGFGPRRLKAVQTALAGLLSRSAQKQSRQRTVGGENGEEPAKEPPVALLLAVDAEYRQKAAAGELKKIAPRRFNPDKEAWLPVLHSEREGWQLTALFSNTKRAHELEMTDDWVVIYFERDGREQQRTVVTETSGPLQGERVVRGREADSRRYHQEQAAHQEKLF